MRFPSLIGSLRTTMAPLRRGFLMWFPSLIGSLRTMFALAKGDADIVRFPSLIGSLRTVEFDNFSPGDGASFHPS